MPLGEQAWSRVSRIIVLALLALSLTGPAVVLGDRTGAAGWQLVPSGSSSLVRITSNHDTSGLYPGVSKELILRLQNSDPKHSIVVRRVRVRDVATTKQRLRAVTAEPGYPAIQGRTHSDSSGTDTHCERAPVDAEHGLRCLPAGHVQAPLHGACAARSETVMTPLLGLSLRALTHRLAPVVVAMVIAGTAATAWAYWTTNAAAGSTGAATAATVNQGATPSVTLTSIGREASLSWGASTLSNGTAVTGYLVKRYPAGGGVATISPIGTCSGTVTSMGCAEEDVPPGNWQYTVTPTVGSWRGTESLLSGVVTVGAATMGVNGSPFGNAAFTPVFATTTGTLSGFSGYGGGEGVSYRLDAATALTGSPSAVGTNGSAAITSLAIPKTAGDGAHTVYAIGDAAYVASQASAGIVIDTTAPAATATLTPAANAAGWNNTTPIGVTLSANDGSGSGLNQIKYTTDGSDPTSSGTAQVYSGSPISISAQGTTTVKYYASDIAGNASAVQTQLVKIDTAPPTNSISLTSLSGGVFPTSGPLADGSSIYYRGAAVGSFTIGNSVGDALSGPASSSTSALAGGASGWTHISSLVATPSGGPYVSNLFSWSAGTTSGPARRSPAAI